MKRAAFVAVLLAVALTVVACRKPTEGEPCRAIGEATCVDATHVRVCRGYAWHVDTCRGPVGCTGTAGHAVCDARRADEGDGCGERGKTSCTRDGSALLECNGSTFVTASTCRGAGGCALAANETGGARCDARRAREGDACTTPRPHLTRSEALNVVYAGEPPLGSRNGRLASGQVAACSLEGDAELVCVDGTFALYKRCRGPKGCTALETKVVCDDSIAEAGDPCRSLTQVCGKDGRTSLRCTDSMNGRYAVLSTCGGPAGCSTNPNAMEVECDDSVAEPGDLCGMRGSIACTHDGKKLLRCGPHLTCRLDGRGVHHYVPSSGPPVFAELQNCPRGCRVTRKPDGNGFEVSVQCK